MPASRSLPCCSEGWQKRLGRLRMLLEDKDRELGDLRSLLAEREGRIQELVQDMGFDAPTGGKYRACRGAWRGAAAGAQVLGLLLGSAQKGDTRVGAGHEEMMQAESVCDEDGAFQCSLALPVFLCWLAHNNPADV